MKCICCENDVLVCIGEIPPTINFAGRLLSKPIPGGHLFRCQNCGVSFRHPQLDKAALDSLYRQGAVENWQAIPSERPDWQIVERWLTKSLKAGSAILDIGCFDGGFLKSVKHKHKLFGIEIHDEAAKRAGKNGIHIVGKDFSDITNSGYCFDAVTSFDVIEHSQNPLEFLRQMVEVTNSGGVVIFSTGNSDALSWRLLGSRYWYCTIGEHLTFVNPKWCEWAGKQLDLELKQIVRFSHVHATWQHRISDVIKNVLYAFSPRGFSMLRKFGLGGSEFRGHKEMLSQPPNWMSAQDHIICIFIKR